ncbi:MFS transporter [Nocardia panacis]|uniref:MFS transporter n=1 Tax=Nocardia panacis TaxID=2340916 RepID=UPI001315A260|nr:MFS transporter [Nocardia panacis]
MGAHHAVLAAHLGWRPTLVVLALVLAAVTLPLRWLCLTPPWSPHHGHTRERGATHIRAVAGSRAFALLTAASCLTALAIYGATSNLVPLLVDRGVDGRTAATVLGLCGAGQLLGRLGYPALARRTHPPARTAVVMSTACLAAVLLAAVPGPLPMLVGVSVFAGAARGALTLVQATAVSDRWGTRDFATLNALACTPAALAVALGPATGTFLANSVGGYPTACALLGCAAAFGALLALGTKVDRVL